MASTTKRKNQAADWTPTRWSPVSVQHIIRNAAAYLGTTTYELDGERYTINYPALITPTQYAGILRRTKERTLKKRTTLLSTGYVDCSCGGHIHASNSHGRHHARCPNKCGAMPSPRLDRYITLAMACRYAMIAESESARNTDDEHDSAIESLKIRIGELTDKISALLEVYLAKDLSKADWKAKHALMEGERARLQSELNGRQEARKQHRERRANEQTVEARVRSILAELAMSEPTLDRKREVLADLLQGGRVVVRWIEGGATLTFPPFGSLPAITVSTLDDIWSAMLGPDAESRHGMYVSLRDLGRDPEPIEAEVIAGLPPDAKVVSRKVRPDGAISILIKK